MKLLYDIIANYLTFFTLELFISNTSNPHSGKRIKLLRIFYLSYWTATSLIPHIPLYDLMAMILNFIYIYLAITDKLIKKFRLFLKYHFFYYTLYASICIIHIIILQDLTLLNTNGLYYSFTALSCTAITYILFSLYINRKRIMFYQKGKSYMRQFNLISVITVCALTLSTFLLDTKLFSVEQTVPLIFTFIIVIVSLCLNAYQKIATTVEENAQTQLQLEKVKLEQGYYAAIEDKLDEIRTLRHDMKNHLLIIDGYAREHNDPAIHEYIARITGDFSHTKIIQTESEMISSIVNAKSDRCQRLGIRFEFQSRFSAVTIDDYSLITILGNLLDNAITAAGKTDSGYIRLCISELDSYLSVQCENNHCEQIQKKEGRLVSTKAPSSQLHGLGLKSIEKAVAALHGSLDLQYDQHTFKISMLLPNYE